MKNFYIPTSSLNFNNILSSESISPKAFYSARSFGYGRWTSIPENPYDNSIVLYDQLCGFNRPASDYEDHPMVIEIALDESVYSTFVEMKEHVYLCDHSIYIDPFSSSLFFFTEKDRRIALSMSDASIETKFVQLYNKKIIVVTPSLQPFPAIDATTEKQELNMAEIEKDKRTNRMKGLLYGYYIGAILSASKDEVAKLNNAREIYNILAAILASFEHKATEQQRKRLKALYETFLPPASFLSKLSTLVAEKSLFEAIVSLVREEYGYVRGEFDVDRILAQLLEAPVSPEAKNPVVENISTIIKQVKSDISKHARLLSVNESQIVVIDGLLTHLSIDGLSDHDKKLCVAWINEVLSKDCYNGKVSTFKDILSDDVTRKAKEVCDGEWKGSYPEITLNALRRHVRGDDFPHLWNNNIYSSMSAVVVCGDDWQKMLQYMQSKMMTDYRIAFAFYGTLNGFANLPRDFTDILFSQGRKYIADVYKEFYGQLFGRDVIIPEKFPSAEKIQQQQVEENLSDLNIQDNSFQQGPINTTTIGLKENVMSLSSQSKMGDEIEISDNKFVDSTLSKFESLVKIIEKNAPIKNKEKFISYYKDEVLNLCRSIGSSDSIIKYLSTIEVRYGKSAWEKLLPKLKKELININDEGDSQQRLFNLDSASLGTSFIAAPVMFVDDKSAIDLIRECVRHLDNNTVEKIIKSYKDLAKGYQFDGFYTKRGDNRNNVDTINHFIRFCTSDLNRYNRISKSNSNVEALEKLKNALIKKYGYEN